MALYILATLTPVALLAVASLLGGAWAWAALGYIALLTAALDESLPKPRKAKGNTAGHFVAKALSVVLALAHPVLIALGLWAIAGPSGLTPGARIALFLALGLFSGQVSNANAHELIHRKSRVLQALGRMVYIVMLFGHHASAHLLIHHRLVGTRQDPNTAREGENCYQFFWRAWRGSFRKGLAEETARRKTRARGLHPYAWYVGGAVAALGTAALIAGLPGVVVFVWLTIFSGSQLLLSDYVQHYGLRRGILADGTPERQGPQHSWNAPHVFSSALLLNAPRHSDHHLNAGRTYPELRLDDQTMPMLPHSLPVMALIALWPPLWRRVMDPLAAAWQPAWEGRGGVPQKTVLVPENGGLPRPALPSSGHVHTPQPDDPARRPARAGPAANPDERGGV